MLMEHLPPVGWADVVTKHDLDRRLEVLEQRILATVRLEITTQIAAQTRTMIMANTVTALTVAGLGFGAAQLV